MVSDAWPEDNNLVITTYVWYDVIRESRWPGQCIAFYVHTLEIFQSEQNFQWRKEQSRAYSCGRSVWLSALLCVVWGYGERSRQNFRSHWREAKSKHPERILIWGLNSMITGRVLKCNFRNIFELWGSAPALINVIFAYNESTGIFIWYEERPRRWPLLLIIRRRY